MICLLLAVEGAVVMAIPVRQVVQVNVTAAAVALAATQPLRRILRQQKGNHLRLLLEQVVDILPPRGLEMAGVSHPLHVQGLNWFLLLEETHIQALAIGAVMVEAAVAVAVGATVTTTRPEGMVVQMEGMEKDIVWEPDRGKLPVHGGLHREHCTPEEVVVAVE